MMFVEEKPPTGSEKFNHTTMIPSNIDWDNLEGQNQITLPGQKSPVDRNAVTTAIETDILGLEPQTVYFNPVSSAKDKVTYPVMVTTKQSGTPSDPNGFFFTKENGVKELHARIDVTFNPKDPTNPGMNIIAMQGEVSVSRNGLEPLLIRSMKEAREQGVSDGFESTDLFAGDVIKVGNVSCRVVLRPVPNRENQLWELNMIPVKSADV